MAGALSGDRRTAGVEPALSGHWEMIEGPSSLIALRRQSGAQALCVVDGEVVRTRAEAGADRGGRDDVGIDVDLVAALVGL